MSKSDIPATEPVELREITMKGSPLGLFETFLLCPQTHHLLRGIEVRSEMKSVLG